MDTLRGVTKALISDTVTFDIEVLRKALELMTSVDPLPRLTLRCFTLALVAHTSTTIAVIVQVCGISLLVSDY